MPCVRCRRRIAVLPSVLCSDCAATTRISRRPAYRPAHRDEQPETD